MKGLTHKESEQLRERARQYKAEGHTMKEVAERFELSLGYTTQICKGIAPQKPDLKGKARNQWTSKPIELREARAIETINKCLPFFEYVGGFTNCDGSVDLKCQICGTIITRSLIGIRHGNGVSCPTCKEIEKENKQKEKEKKTRFKQLERNRKAALRKLDKCKQLSFKACVECGTIYIPTANGQKCCSIECSRKRANRNKDKRINKNNLVDRDITLVKLYSRDNGKCYICGCVCDWNDKLMDGNGNTIVGKRYPTIEHVHPLSKGGKHSWPNVKLACFSCNTIKSDTPPVNFLQLKNT